MNTQKIFSVIYYILIRIYWIAIGFLCVLLVFLAVVYYRNHYSDPEKSRFQEYIWDAATLNLNTQNQKSFEQCLKEQNIQKKYPSQIMRECLSKAKSS